MGSFEVSWPARVEPMRGVTSPEELLGAAHAACYSMALSHGLTGKGMGVDVDVDMDMDMDMDMDLGVGYGLYMDYMVSFWGVRVRSWVRVICIIFFKSTGTGTSAGES